MGGAGCGAGRRGSQRVRRLLTLGAGAESSTILAGERYLAWSRSSDGHQTSMDRPRPPARPSLSHMRLLSEHSDWQELERKCQPVAAHTRDR